MLISKPKKTEHVKFSEKQTFFTPWCAHAPIRGGKRVRMRQTRAYQGVKNVLFSENLTCFVFFETPVLEFTLLPYYRRIYQYFCILVYPCLLLILFNPFLKIKKYCPLKYVYLSKDIQFFLSKVLEFRMVTIFSLNFCYLVIICFVARD